MAQAFQTYILLANPAASPAAVRITFLRTNGTTVVKTFTVNPTSRFNVHVNSVAPELVDETFGALVEVTSGSGISVERALYSDALGQVWAAGTNALATPVDAVPAVPNPAAVTVTASDPVALEQGLDAGVFTFSRSAAGAAQTVAYTVSGSATPGTDYRALMGTVTIPAGATSATVIVTPSDDSLAEPTETITLSLLPDPGYTIAAPASATVSLQDDDTVVVPGTEVDYSRFLTQATFGPTPASLQELRTLGYDAWITAQAAKPVSSFLGFIDHAAGVLE